MTSTSANPAGGTPARSADEVATVLGTLADRQDVLVLDAGPLHETVPSTVVDCTGEVPRVVRAGAIDVSRLRRVVREIDD